MIGGRILDTSALLAFARGTSIYAAAAVWTAVEESIVLLQLPVTVIDALGETRARAIGQLGGTQTDAPAIACAQERGWPLITAHPDHYTRYQQTGVDLEPLP
ncbi:MAG: hypothetical protein WCF33_01735 [Pseudonocardiaceae bacterium]